jgi:N4-gp56 family major capsid protein
MADAYTTYAVMQNDAVNTYIATKMIALNERRQVLQKVCDIFTIEQRNSKNIRVVRVKRLALPTEELVEGVTPNTNALELEEVNATAKQWGIVALLTDVVQITVKHNMVQKAIERVAMAMAEVEEREAAQVMMSGTNVTYPGAITARGSLAASDVATTALFITVAAKLKMRGAPRTSAGTYIGIIQPPHTAALLGSDTVFQQASSFARDRRLDYGYLGTWMNIDFTEGNFLPQFVGVAAASTAAASATKAKYTVGTSGSLATANYQLIVVGREVLTDYERRISVQTGNIAVTGPDGSILVETPTSTNYTYDVYMTAAGGTTAYKVASRKAASSSFNITTAPAGTEAVAPVPPASGVSVYPGWVFGTGAFGVVKLDGMSLQTYVTPNGASDSDPLNQRKKIGAKYMQHFFWLDQNFAERFEASSSIAAYVPA